ncbi:MAG TPA: energy transducer TonB [Pyrinomonadaceae bacterium]|nr:energy transducer TonB [Pyrinomonadaceae bacterium]
MSYKNYWKKIVPFSLALTISLLAVNVLQKENSTNRIIYSKKGMVIHSEKGTGQASCSHKGTESVAPFIDEPLKKNRLEKGKIQILSKPIAKYTDGARQNGTEGTVRLRVSFLASGQIGGIVPVSSLPDCLTEQAIAAARQIKFEPATRSGQPVSVTKLIEYNFTIY